MKKQPWAAGAVVTKTLCLHSLEIWLKAKDRIVVGIFV